MRGVGHCELGALLRNNSQHAAGITLFVMSTTAFIIVNVKPALAEFQIQEAGIEKGEVALTDATSDTTLKFQGSLNF
jgi:hypothetical protein